jgi:hypothetical protein
MNPRVFVLAVGLVACFSPAFAGEKPKPRCNAQMRGRFWPEDANGNPLLAQAYARSGQLEICTREIWRHRWEPVTVHIRQLEAKHGVRRTARTGQAAGGGSD